MPAVSSVAPSGTPYIDYLESGAKWAVNSFTYSFPTSAAFYVGFNGASYGSGEENSGFKPFTAIQQAATASILNMYSSVANVTFTQIAETSTQSADLRYAESNQPATAWGYYPSISPEGGDAWFNNSSGWYNNPVVGDYAWLTIIHETGHLLGLKHPQDAMGSFGAAPVSADSLEYSVMSYRSYIGASTTQGLTNATWSFPQTLMMDDVAALQYMYGANFSTNGGDTVYKWNPATGQETINGVAQAAPGGNTIFMTIWDGGGTDTYDFSNYTTNLSVNLQPGGWTTVSAAELANLGAGHTAIGNIANAYLYENNPASLIENVIGGSGSDTIVGNAANNKLTGAAGNDALDGVSGTDTAVYSGQSASYHVTQNSDGSWTVADLRAGSPDGTDTLKNIDFLQFSDKTIAIGTIAPPPVVQAPTINSFSPDTANVGDGIITQVNVLTLTGTAQANATVKIYDGTTLLGSTITNVNGAWTFVTSALTDATHTFTATAADSTGDTSAASSAMNVIVDTVAPISPTIGLQSVDSGIAGDGITNVKVVSLTGTAEINSTIKVYDGTTLLGSATANAEGVWNFVADMSDDQIAALATSGLGSNANSTADAAGANQTQSWGFTTAPLSDGAHNFTVTSTDAAGNVSAVSTDLNVTIDTMAPNAPVIMEDTTLNTNQVMLIGTAEAGSTVKLFEGTAVLGTTTANASGAWSFTTGPLSSGAHAFTATAIDVAGNTSLVSQPLDPLIGGTTIEAAGSSSLVQVGSHYYLDDATGAGPSLAQYGADITVGQFGNWTPLGVEKTATGYEVAWKVTGADQYSVWTTDNNGNFLATTSILSGASTALKTAESAFHQDLNGDGIIGFPAMTTTVIESVGATSLAQVGSHYYLDDATGAGPSLAQYGADITVGQFGNWTPLGVEKTATGYEVAWKVTGADQYSVWTTDNNGNFLATTSILSGASTALKTAESAFHQDLNGDGIIGFPAMTTTVIESVGATSLAQVGSHYYLDDATGAGPSLAQYGADITVGQFGNWTPLGVEKTATGYEVAWKVTGADQYSVWTTDNNGNFLATTSILSGASTALKTAESAFHQDLNGDGIIGFPAMTTTVIESVGATSLAQVGSHYYLDDATGAGPSLAQYGADITVGQFGNWTPLGVEKTATGYEVAWKVTGADQYSVWTTDNNGNFLATTSILSGASTALKTAESAFHQDLNGDGMITVAGSAPAMVSGTAGNDTITSSVANEVFYGNGGTNTFVFSGNFGKDVVADFQANSDVIQLDHNPFANFADVLAHTAQVGAEVTISVDASASITLSHTTLAQLMNHNFHLM